MTAVLRVAKLGECEPRFATEPQDRPHRLDEMAAIAHRLGDPWPLQPDRRGFMPWQELVARVASERDPDTGLPAYRTVVVTVPRQSGKTTVVLAFEVDRCVSWERPQLVAYTAQTGKDAREKLIDDQAPSLERKAKRVVERVYRAIGAEAVKFVTGSRIIPLPNTPDAGHGKTIHLAVRDELFADKDDRRSQALTPAMATVADAQDLVTSTAGTAESVPLRRLVELGRRSVAEGRTSGIAYFEWSAAEDDDPDDEDVWWRCMPALGRTISIDVVRHARATESDGEFRRAFLNQWWDAETSVFPAGLWDACATSSHSPQENVVFAVDGKPDLSAAAVVAADPLGRLEVIESRGGVEWVWARCVELAQKWDAPIVVDEGGPLGYLAQRFRDDGVAVESLGTRDVVHACQSFYDAVISNKLRVRISEPLNLAVASAEQRKVGEAWMWSRYTATDPSPLVAATIAHHVASRRTSGEVSAWFV